MRDRGLEGIGPDFLNCCPQAKARFQNETGWKRELATCQTD